MPEDRLELQLREALHREVAHVHVGVTSQQVRAGIAARERARRTTRGVIAVAAVLAAALAIPILASIIVPGPAAPKPGSMEPATVAAIDAASGDLVLSRAWPDGRVDEAGRYPGALDLLQTVTGGAAALPADAGAAEGPGGRFAIALRSGDLLVFRGPGDGQPFSLAGTGPGGVTWIGWSRGGVLVAVDEAAIRLVDADTGNVTTRALPSRVLPYSARLGAVEALTWTGDDRIVARRSDPATFSSTIGSVDVLADAPGFVAGLPASVRAITGLEPRLAADGSEPTGWQSEPVAGNSAVGIRVVVDDVAPDVRWYAAGPGELVFDVVRSADQRGLLALVAAADGSAGHVVAIDAPGSWREALTLGFAAAAGPASEAATFPRVAGVAPSGRSIALTMGQGLIVGDLLDAVYVDLSAGTVFVGWPESVLAPADAAPTLPTCAAPSAETAGQIALSAAAATTPAASGAPPVVGDPADPDPWRRAQLTAADPVTPPADGTLVLALPAGACVEAFLGEAMEVGASGGAQPVALSSQLAGQVPSIAGLLDVAGPPAGDWIVRVKVWLLGASRESILLYHVRTDGTGDTTPVPTPEQP